MGFAFAFPFPETKKKWLTFVVYCSVFVILWLAIARMRSENKKQTNWIINWNFLIVDKTSKMRFSIKQAGCGSERVGCLSSFIKSPDTVIETPTSALLTQVNLL